MKEHSKSTAKNFNTNDAGTPTDPNSNKKAVYELTIEDNNKTYKCLLCEPNRFVIEAALAEVAPIGKDPKLIKAGELILNSCWVSGDDEIRTIDRLLVSAALQAYEMINMANATLKKI